MHIEPGKEYGHLIFIDTETQRQWTIRGPLSGDLTAGLVLGLYTVHSDMVKNHNHDQNDDDCIYIGETEEDVRVRFEDILDDTLMLYVDADETENQGIDEFEFFGTFDSLGWWILDPKTGYHVLYDFDTSDFIRGFITITQAFRVDFRSYIHGLPFKVTNDQQEFYQIQGYHIP